MSAGLVMSANGVSANASARSSSRKSNSSAASGSVSGSAGGGVSPVWAASERGNNVAASERLSAIERKTRVVD